MKKFLLFLVIAIASITIGLTIYYFSIDNEVIMIKSAYLMVDKGDTISTDSLLEFKHRDNNTKLSFGISQNGDSEVLSYNSGDGYYVAKEGGESKIVVSTTNGSYPKLVINVMVCDGSQDYPYIISSKETLSKIGREGEEKYLSSLCYKLGNNIALEQNDQGNWTPMSSFSGVFDGNYYTISNLNITDNTLNASNTNVGFISKIEATGLVKNLYFDNLSINVSNVSNVGSVAGILRGNLQNVEVKGNIALNNDTASYVGGVVGTSDYSTIKPKVDRCGFQGGIGLVSTTGNQIGGGVVGYNKSGIVSESYYRTTTENFVQNSSNAFGGIVGLNEGNTQTADLYDSYFYVLNSNQNTNYSKIGGIVYNNININYSLTNVIMGNYYYGGVTEVDGQMISKVTNGSQVNGTGIEGKYNGFLTALEFSDKNEKTTKFVTYISTDLQKRLWDFNSVWEMGDCYPLLNMFSASGSTYPKDFSNLIGENDIISAQDFYNAMCNSSESASYKVIGNNNNGTYEIDFSALDWKWGDQNHPIPSTFSGTLFSTNNCVIKGLNIVNNTAIVGENVVNVGLVGTLSTSARIVGLTFKDVTISGFKATNVGVLCGYNDGADISNIVFEDVNVLIEGKNFGAVSGYSQQRQERYIQNVTITKLDASNALFENAGGIVGWNCGDITINRLGENPRYNILSSVKLYALNAGGAVGVNYGNIRYIDANDIVVDASDTSKSLYTNIKSLIVGSIVGINCNTGTVSEVYGKLTAKAVSGQNYFVSIGGIAGYNYGDITRAYSSACSISVADKYCVYAGGLVGANNGGKISRSVVNKGVIDCSTVLSNNKITNGTNTYPTVGGLVGFDATTTADYSISECGSLIDSITGAYVGGLVGLSFGKVSKCYSGSQTKQVYIKGFVAGGLCATISGKVEDCYTICKISGIYTNNSYKDTNSIINLEVSSKAGLAVIGMTGSEIRGCYAVVDFKDGGVRLSTIADIESVGYRAGVIEGCIYTSQGENGQNRYGKLFSIFDLNGKTDQYLAFYKYIGSKSNNVWSTKDYGYPTIYNLDQNLPKAKASI